MSVFKGRVVNATLLFLCLKLEEMIHKIKHTGGYVINIVYQCVDRGLQQKIVEFWMANNAIATRAEAERRVKEVSAIVVDQDSNIVGVASVSMMRWNDEVNPFYYFRAFIDRKHRVPMLSIKLLNMVTEYLQKYEHPDHPSVQGILIVTENKKLMSENIRKKAMLISDYKYQGIGPKGNDCWLLRF